MSTIEPDDAPQYPGNPLGRWLAGAFTIGLVIAAAVAVYLEPFFLLDRVRGAVREGNEVKQRALVDPDLIGPDLAAWLEASRPAQGRRIAQGYETPSRFLVTVLPEGESGEVDSTGRLVLVLERRGLAWWLADVAGSAPWSISGLPLPPHGITPGDSLPAFGSYVYVEELPQVSARVAPVYPEAARRAGIQGTVTVQALVGTDGVVRDARVVDGIPALDAAALQAVRQWRFEPARAGGKPVAVWVSVPVRFSLH